MPQEYQSAESFFDAFSQTYDERTPGDFWHVPNVVAEAVQHFENLNSVLIVGAGTGHDVALMKARGATYIEGIDISEKMLAVARGKYPDCVFHHGDFLTFTGFNRKAYDLIICCGVLEFISDVPVFLKKCRSLLRCNGILAMTFVPILEDHDVQRHAVSDNADHIIFRIDISQFLRFAEQSYFKVRSYFLFDAYTDGGITTKYYLAVLQKKCRWRDIVRMVQGRRPSIK